MPSEEVLKAFQTDELWLAVAEKMVCGHCAGTGQMEVDSVHTGMCSMCRGLGGSLREPCPGEPNHSGGNDCDYGIARDLDVIDGKTEWVSRTCYACAGRGWTPIRSRNAVEAAITAQGWRAVHSIESPYHIIGIYKANGTEERLIASINSNDQLRGDDAVLTATLHALEKTNAE